MEWGRHWGAYSSAQTSQAEPDLRVSIAPWRRGAGRRGVKLTITLIYSNHSSHVIYFVHTQETRCKGLVLSYGTIVFFYHQGDGHFHITLMTLNQVLINDHTCCNNDHSCIPPRLHLPNEFCKQLVTGSHPRPQAVLQESCLQMCYTHFGSPYVFIMISNPDSTILI